MSSMPRRYFKCLAYFLYFLFITAIMYGFIMLPDGWVDYDLKTEKFDKRADVSMMRISGDRGRVQGSQIFGEYYRRSTSGKNSYDFITTTVSDENFPKLVEKKRKSMPGVEENKTAGIISLNSSKYGEIMIENILGEDPQELHKRLVPPENVGNDVKIIALDDQISHISDDNMGGCETWRCTICPWKSVYGKIAEALLIGPAKEQEEEYKRDISQYYVFFTQESAVNQPAYDFPFNLSLNFLRDSPVSSPYGYTVKLAKPSRHVDVPITDDTIRHKKKPVAWFVSNCHTASKREIYVRYLKKYLTVDVFGFCGKKSCFDCEEMLNSVYYFYLAFENSVCRDYITEKLWKHGYQHDIIPIVLKRSIVERYVPPNSFIAVDDFTNVRDLADYLKYLMNNISAYRTYFEWRREYKVLFLDGNNHDELERPWGFCQLCRLLWMEPHPAYAIQNFSDFWSNSCEIKGEVVNRILQEERKLWEDLDIATIESDHGKF